MSLFRRAALGALLLPSLAFASNAFNVASSTCTGDLVSSYTDGISFTCTGNFSLSHGTIGSDTAIFLSATGLLQLTDIAFTGHNITLNAGDALNIDASTSFKFNDEAPAPDHPGKITLQGGVLLMSQDLRKNIAEWQRVDLGAGSEVQITQPGSVQLSAIPEPGSLALAMAGVMSIGLAFFKRSQA